MDDTDQSWTFDVECDEHGVVTVDDTKVKARAAAIVDDLDSRPYGSSSRQPMFPTKHQEGWITATVIQDDQHHTCDDAGWQSVREAACVVLGDVANWTLKS